MARLSHGTTRFSLPLSRDFSVALLNSVRFHLKLYGMARAPASYSVKALGKLLEGFAARNGAEGRATHLLIRASGSTLRITLRLPPGLIAATRLKALLPASPPGVEVLLKSGKSGPVLTLEASIPDRE